MRKEDTKLDFTGQDIYAGLNTGKAARAELPGSADILSAKNADKMSALPGAIF